MKRFINLQDQILQGMHEFAFYDTCTCEFETFNDSCTWESIYDFINDMREAGEPEDQIKRRIGLIPSNFLLGNFAKFPENKKYFLRQK